MIDLQSNIQQPFSFDESLLPYTTDRQFLCALILDTIDTEIDAIAHLFSEGSKLLEALDDDINAREIASIVHHLNHRLFQQAIRINVLKYKI